MLQTEAYLCDHEICHYLCTRSTVLKHMTHNSTIEVLNPATGTANFLIATLWKPLIKPFFLPSTHSLVPKDIDWALSYANKTLN